MSYGEHFSRFLQSRPHRIHAAAHSHHPWPDVTFAAQQQAWADAARLHDDKWDAIFGSVIPEAQAHIARRLSLPDPTTVAFAPNTHELVARVVSCLPDPARVLTTDSEFHSFGRQLARWVEAGRVAADRVPTQPFATFAERFTDAAASGRHDLVYFSQVFFNSGFVVDDLTSLVASVAARDTFVVVDGYHGFMALPTAIDAIADRAFYVAGGYKYAMAGEGACFLHCPPGYGPRPVDTGWFAGFGALVTGAPDEVAFPPDGGRFLGATFDPTPLYRFNAVQRWLDHIGVTVDDIHRHVTTLQQQFLAGVHGILPPPDVDAGAHFVSFRMPEANDVQRRLAALDVVTDSRGDRLRIGLGLYHDAADIDELVARVAKVVESGGPAQ